MPRIRLYRGISLGLWSVLSASCIGTSTGNPIGSGSRDVGKPEPTGPDLGEETGNGGRCEVVSSRDVAEGEQTPLNFAPRDVLANVLREHAETLHWQPITIGSYGPESGDQALTVTLTRTNAPLRFVDYEPKSGGPEIGGDCPDALEIEVNVGLKSALGALDERFVAKLSARSKHVARLYHVLDADQLGGALEFDNISDGFMFTKLAVELSATQFGTAGSLTPTLEKRSGESGADGASSNAAVSGGRGGVLAYWGSAMCRTGVAVPRTARFASFSADDVLARLAVAQQACVRWSDASESALTLSFESSDEGACAVLEESRFSFPNEKTGTLLFTGTLAAASADGRIAATWPVELTARPSASGELEVIALQLDQNVRRDNPSLRDYGLSGFDVSSYDFFSVNVALALGGGGWSGEIGITGFTRPNCPTTPVTDPSGGASSPGCPGATPTPVASASVSSP